MIINNDVYDIIEDSNGKYVVAHSYAYHTGDVNCLTKLNSYKYFSTHKLVSDELMNQSIFSILNNLASLCYFITES